MKLNKEFWEQCYTDNSTGWDIGNISTPIKVYIDQLKDKDLSILIPGAGNAHEAEYLHQQGFNNITVADIAEQPLNNLIERIPYFPKERIFHGDFFEINGQFDLILEQTFFCALDPSLRPDYARKIYELTGKKGKAAGLLFDFPLTAEGPPFGGNAKEYISLFEPYFEIKTLESCYNSIKPREGRELFFIFEKRIQQ